MSIFRFFWPTIAVLASVGFLAEDIQKQKKYRAFSGPVESAVVQSVRHVRTQAITKRKSNEISHYIHTGEITFTTKSGRQVIISDFSLPTPQASNFRVEYPPDDPQTVRMQGEESEHNPNLRWVIMGMLVGSIALWIRAFLKKPDDDYASIRARRR